jgi:hypothetical protein
MTVHGSRLSGISSDARTQRRSFGGLKKTGQGGPRASAQSDDLALLVSTRRGGALVASEAQSLAVEGCATR